MFLFKNQEITLTWLMLKLEIQEVLEESTIFLLVDPWTKKVSKRILKNPLILSNKSTNNPHSALSSKRGNPSN